LFAAGTKPAAIPDFHLMQIGESAEFEVYNLADPEEAKKVNTVLDISSVRTFFVAR
jgi:hypothetical protein